MENKDDESAKKKEKEEPKKKPVAKDKVKLKHVEVKKQEISPETRNLAQMLKESFVEHDQFVRLTNDELTILESFMGKRLFLERIAIIVNQSRILMGIPGFKRAELEDILEGLISKGYIDADIVGEKPVFYLTERGKYRVQ